MAENQNHRADRRSSHVRQVLKLNVVEASNFVPGNKKFAGSEAVAFSFAPHVASIRAALSNRVVAIPSAGFGQAAGGPPIKTSAAHITKPSTPPLSG